MISETQFSGASATLATPSLPMSRFVGDLSSLLCFLQTLLFCRAWSVMQNILVYFSKTMTMRTCLIERGKKVAMNSFTGSITYNWPVQKDGGFSKGGKKYFQCSQKCPNCFQCVTIDWRCQTAKILFAFQRLPSPTKSAHIARWRSANKSIPSRNPKPHHSIPRFSKVFKGDESLGLYTSGHGDFHMEEPMLFSGRSRQFSLTFDIQYLTWPRGQFLTIEILWICPFLKFWSLPWFFSSARETAIIPTPRCIGTAGKIFHRHFTVCVTK